MRRLPKFALVATALLAAGLGASCAQWSTTQRDPWCAQQPGEAGGIFDCSYATFEQCREFVRGVGHFCLRNPRNPYVAEVRAPAPRQRAQKRTQ